ALLHPTWDSRRDTVAQLTEYTILAGLGAITLLVPSQARVCRYRPGITFAATSAVRHRLLYAAQLSSRTEAIVLPQLVAHYRQHDFLMGLRHRRCHGSGTHQTSSRGIGRTRAN